MSQPRPFLLGPRAFTVILQQTLKNPGPEWPRVPSQGHCGAAWFIVSHLPLSVQNQPKAGWTEDQPEAFARARTLCASGQEGTSSPLSRPVPLPELSARSVMVRAAQSASKCKVIAFLPLRQDDTRKTQTNQKVLAENCKEIAPLTPAPLYKCTQPCQGNTPPEPGEEGKCRYSQCWTSVPPALWLTRNSPRGANE